MTAGEAAAFACGRPHPQLGAKVPCVRQRHHGGDHRASSRDGRLYSWPDMTVGEFLEQSPAVKAHRGGWAPLEVAGVLDEQTETWTMPPWRPAERALIAAFVLSWLVVIAALIKYLFT